jgi:alkylation response protein AidB-like acyl-CoA dehydrogenase
MDDETRSTQNPHRADGDDFRSEVRKFLEEKFTPELRAAAARQAGAFAEGELVALWHRILYEQGWVAPYWPAEYGGPGWTNEQRATFYEECIRLGTPNLPSMGLSLCGPVIMQYGTPEQKSFFLPRILSGEHYWCQGYSEPQSGSDLASLQTRARRDGDEYVLNGSKIWTTHAHNANWIFLLVRTAESEKPQDGISFLVAPMSTVGITVRPLRLFSGEHEVNQVFLDDVRVPVANRIGPENKGWSVAKYLLEFERGGTSSAAGLRVNMAKLSEIARQERGDDGLALIDDAAFRRDLANHEIQLMAIDWTEQRLASGLSVGQSVGAAGASLKKLTVSEFGQSLEALAMEALGPYASPDQRMSLGMHANEPPIGPSYAATPTARYLNGRATTIAGGSSEVQHNIIARLALGLR